MKILLTGGGTGGHFYPIIAVTQAIKEEVVQNKLVTPELYFMSTDPYDPNLLLESGLIFIPAKAGKLRRYFSLRNLTDSLTTIFGIIQAVWQMYLIYPDVVFGKGGYASFPAMFAARLLRIPVVIHESDSHPGRVNLWAAKFAKRIALSYPEALKYFPKDKTAVTGNPLREEVKNPIKNGAREFLDLEPEVPVIMVLGGSQGSAKINNIVLENLPELLNQYIIIHQVGAGNYAEIKERSELILAAHPHRTRYKMYDFLNPTALRMAAGVAELVISRAGSTIFEIAIWGVPSIIIPIPQNISHDQYDNAFTYARAGGAVVVEEKNLTPSILLSEVERLMSNSRLREEMSAGAKSYARPEAARLIAEEILKLALQHEH